ncbi:MAG: hypothetical protein RLZZ324_737 [Candidatus Parcubacteria bacterium]|jgi:drug/metabolite transporter (DMT)-like permease
MSPVLYAVIGVFLYATQNIIIDAKLRPYSTGAVVLLFYVAMFPWALATLAKMKFSGQAIVWPSGSALWLTFLAGTVFYFADYFYVGAYNNAGGNVFMVTVCAGLMPVFIAFLALVLTATVPNLYQAGAILLAIGAVWLAAKGGVSAPVK